MKQVRRLKKVGFLLFCLLFFLVGCTPSDLEETEAIRSENPYIRFHPFEEWRLAWIEELEVARNPYGAISVGLGTPFQLEVYLADPNIPRDAIDFEVDPNFIDFVSFHLINREAHLYMSVTATSISDHTYTVVLFLNYEQIAFRVLGEEAYASQFDLIIPSGYTAFIPFTLDFDQIISDGAYRLTLAVFTDQHIHAAEWEEREDFEFLTRVYADWPMWTPPYSVLNYNLLIGEGGVESFAFTESNIDDWVDLPESMGPELLVFWASETSMLDVDIDSPLVLERHIEAYPGEELHFSAWALPPFPDRMDAYGNEIDTIIADYLIISMLNGEQISLNGKPFLYVNLVEPLINEPVAHRIDFTITAPMEPGSYEFVSFLVSNPTSSELHEHVPLDATPRVTIVVSE